jgi:hypothetical protein
LHPEAIVAVSFILNRFKPVENGQILDESGAEQQLAEQRF